MSVPAGWYDDPHSSEQVRWWDGSAWTANVAPKVPQPVVSRRSEAATPPPLPPRFSQADRRPQGSASQPGSVVPDVERDPAAIRTELDALRRELVETRTEMLLQEIGIYEYRHPLDDSVKFKEALKALRGEIKAVAREGRAVDATKTWAINGSAKEGAKMVTDFSKLLLKAYNAESDAVVRSLRPYALDSAIKRLDKTRATVSRLGKSMSIAITHEFHKLRVTELEMTADYLSMKAEEKEAAREERARLREEAAAQRELEAEREKLAKELSHYRSVAVQLQASGQRDAAEEAEAKVAEIERALKGATDRAANIRAGYVYVISNPGAFGRGVVKIGLTRRLEPMDRVRELGDASVPYRFDVHALIFSDDAVSLETALHQRFAAQRLNLVNQRREFFYVAPEQVRDALVELRGELLTFEENAEALEWHQSENLRRKLVESTSHDS